jgi:DNA-binding LacI/PurR family transcriptional regulator
MILHEPARDYPQIITRIPTVRLMGLPVENALWDHVTYDNVAIGHLAGKYLLERGHRNCAFLSPYPGSSEWGYPLITADRQRTFIETIRAAGGSIRVNTTSVSAADPLQTRQALEELFLADPRPTGLFIPSDDFTLMAYGLLFLMGLKPGTDVDVISCNNDLTIMQGLHPRPATIDIHTRWIGSAGVAQLLQRLQSPELPRSTRRFAPTLIPAIYPSAPMLSTKK